ncbi:MAG: hypothetical protein NTV62_03035 [Candidatus Gribaldobacteria bacterium]|nr:hypothetical protein [Candidatus Gribaldobacteria bacterium]
MPKKIFKIKEGRCPKCGEGEFVSEPNQYNVLVFMNDFKIFCWEGGVEVVAF